MRIVCTPSREEMGTESMQLCVLHALEPLLKACHVHMWSRGPAPAAMRHTCVLFRPAAGVYRYLDDATRSGDSAARERLERVAEVLVSDRCRSFADCITWARRLFEV